MRRYVWIIGSIVLGTASLFADNDPVAQDEQLLKSAQVKTDGEALLEFFRRRTMAEGDRAKVE